MLVTYTARPVGDVVAIDDDTAGTVEKEINDLLSQGKEVDANKKIYDLLVDVQLPNNALISATPLATLPNEATDAYKVRVDGLEETKQNYADLIRILERILIKRKSSILTKQVNIFTTNYDLFIENAAENCPAIKLNDGFARTPNLQSRYAFSAQGFFNSTFNNGNLYSYKVEIPNLNLIKIHGSLSWKSDGEDIVSKIGVQDIPAGNPDAKAIQDFNSGFSLIVPQQGKFRKTLLDRVYYDLLRIYSNELDKENTILMVIGFSFGDEHLYDITRRALKNPTLILLIFSFSQEGAGLFAEKFACHNNVHIISPGEDGNITLKDFNLILTQVFERKKETANDNE